MKGRSRAYAAAFIGTVDTYVGLYLADRIELSETVVRQRCANSCTEYSHKE